MARAERRAAAAPAARILVVDDAPDTLELIQRNLASRGHEVTTALRADDALALLDRLPFELVLTDIRMPGRSGLDLIHEVTARHPAVEMVVITGYATLEGAVEALHAGAWDYLAKPFTDEELFGAVERALARRGAGGLGAAPPGRVSEFHSLLGGSRAMLALFAALARAARETTPVRLCGAPGSGREAAARALHAAAARRGAFVRMSLDARLAVPSGGEIADSLAHAAAATAGGTLYLAGFDAAPPASRAAADALLAATAAPSPEATRVVVSVGELEPAREGAWPGVTIEIPPLRERGDDVLRLAQRFVAESGGRGGAPARTFSPRAERALRAYGWPGEVRELRAACAAIAADRSEPIAVAELPLAVAAAIGPEEAGVITLAELERRHIEEVLRRAGGNKSRAAEQLGIDRKTLREKLRVPTDADAGES